MSVYTCSACGYVYDESIEGAAFNQLPSDWVCPICGMGKEVFEKEE